MPRNLELKIRIDDYKKTLRKAKEIGAEEYAFLIQKDIYYQTGKGLLKLRIMPEHSEFIFYNRNEAGGERWSDYHLLKINNEQRPEEFFNRIFDVVAVVEKEREVLMYENTRIHLDKVKGLGEFLELETIVTGTLDDAKERFDFLVAALNLDETSQIKKSYKDLIIENASL